MLRKARIVRVYNTLNLSRLMVSEAVARTLICSMRWSSWLRLT